MVPGGSVRGHDVGDATSLPPSSSTNAKALELPDKPDALQGVSVSTPKSAGGETECSNGADNADQNQRQDYGVLDRCGGFFAA